MTQRVNWYSVISPMAAVSAKRWRPSRVPTAARRVSRSTRQSAAAHERVAQLVGSYAPDQRQERPTAEQIAEVVRACAHLNAVEWAEERQRLKSVCGEGLRLVDLDRLYREARRDLERQSLPSEDRYLVVDGCIVYEKVTERGVSRQKITDWTAQVVERSSRIDDDGQVEHLVKLELSRLGKTQPLVVPSELFGDANALQRHIARQAGERFTARTGMSKHLPTALLSLSEDYPTRTTYRFMGWTKIDGHWAFVTPGLTVDANGVCEQPPEVELEMRLRDYGLRAADWSQSAAAFAAFKDTLPEASAPALIAYAFLPLVQRFFPAAAPKPALHLQGTTGTGKSEIASLLCSFYGQFTRDLPPSQWGDTVNTVEALGYSLADALYWVDDYKAIYADERTFTRFLQSYSRGMGRGRLTREAKVRQERPCRGHILSTGETTIEGEASVLSRMIVLEIPPWEARDPAGKALVRADEQREALSGFTARFIQWIAAQADADTLAKRLTEGFEQNARSYQDKLRGKLERQAHTGRMVQNWAVLATVYQLLRDFLVELNADQLLPVWQDSIVETVQAVQQERAGQIFLNLLGQLVAGGQCVIADSLRNPNDPAPGATIIGYRDQGFVYLLPEIAYREVSKIQPLKFTAHAIGSQLKEEGILIPGNANLSVQRTVRGGVVRLWRIKSENLGCEGCEGCEVE